MEKGSGKPGREIAGKLTDAQARQIAEVKLDDLNTKEIDQAAKIVKGVARSMGIQTE
jgi:large subunit ribosomal protein L11